MRNIIRQLRYALALVCMLVVLLLVFFAVALKSSESRADRAERVLVEAMGQQAQQLEEVNRKIARLELDSALDNEDRKKIHREHQDDLRRQSGWIHNLSKALDEEKNRNSPLRHNFGRVQDAVMFMEAHQRPARVFLYAEVDRARTLRSYYGYEFEGNFKDENFSRKGNKKGKELLCFAPFRLYGKVNLELVMKVMDDDDCRPALAEETLAFLDQSRFYGQDRVIAIDERAATVEAGCNLVEVWSKRVRAQRFAFEPRTDSKGKVIFGPENDYCCFLAVLKPEDQWKRNKGKDELEIVPMAPEWKVPKPKPLPIFQLPKP